MEHVLERFSKIKLLAFDLDGVLTNGKLLIQSGTEWLRETNIKDGYALQLAVKRGFHVAVISGSFSEPVKERLAALGVHHFYQKISSKSNQLSELIKILQLNTNEVLYMGDDIPDLDAFRIAGLKVCPADAVEEVKQKADYIAVQKGGEGCVREVIERTMKVQDKWTIDYEIKSL
jgi:3-deoxy-D-manno-octulosonate 8-phosphate phosphatase (KDO 8-P phosphatase)